MCELLEKETQIIASIGRHRYSHLHREPGRRYKVFDKVSEVTLFIYECPEFKNIEE